MKNARRIPLIVGLVLALGTGVLMLNYLGSLRGQTPVAPARTVYIAAHDVPARALLNDGVVMEVKRPASEVDPDAVVDRKELIGKYSLITIPTGSVVTPSQLGLGGANALTPRQVDLLASADLNTTLRLALRPPKESIRAFPAEVLKLGVPERAASAPAAPVAPAPAAQAPAPPAQAPAPAPVVAAAKPRPAAPAPNVVPVIELDRIEGGTSRR